MSACFAWSVVVTSALKNFNYSSCYEHIPLGEYNFLIFKLIYVSTVYLLLRATCLMAWNLSYPNFPNLWADATGGTPLCASHFFPPKDLCTQAGCGHTAVREEAESSLRSRQLGGSNAARREKSLTELSSLLLDKPQWPPGICFMLEILEQKICVKVHKMQSLVCLISHWKQEFHLQALFGTSELFLKVTTITDLFAICQSCVPVEVTSSCIGGKLM